MGSAAIQKTALARAILPQVLAVGITYILGGAAFAAVPLFVARDMSMGASVIGLATGLSFLVGIVTRIWAGQFSDSFGPKRTISIGLALVILSGIFSLLAVQSLAVPMLALFWLILARVVVGAAEGIVMVASQSWCLAIAGPARTGLVVGWIGTSMFGAMAIGAPIGGILYHYAGFAAVSIAAIAVPIPLMLYVRGLIPLETVAGEALAMGQVARKIAFHCFTFAFVGIGYGAIVSFAVLLFEEQNWQPVWAGLSCFSIALVAARVIMGSAPDHFGARQTALWSLVVMIFGFVMMGLSEDRGMGILGALLSGLGYSLVYPAITKEALARVPSRNRGSVMALVASSVSLTLAIGGPVLGLIAQTYGTSLVFLIAAGAAAVAFVLIGLFNKKPLAEGA